MTEFALRPNGAGPRASGGNPKTPGRPARGPLAPGARHADEEATR